MNGDGWDERLCRERTENFRQRMRADEEKLHRLEKNSAKLSELSVQMGEIIKYHREQLDHQEKRLTELERKPMKLGNTLWNTFLSTAVSGTVAYLISVILN